MRNKLKCGDLIVITTLDIPEGEVRRLYAERVFNSQGWSSFEVKREQEVVYVCYDKRKRRDCLLLNGVLIMYQINFDATFIKAKLVSSANKTAVMLRLRDINDYF